jgi:hypothetical protein
MPRKLRVEYPGAIYHVMSRGNGRQNIFRGDVDRQDFLKTLKRITHWRERSRAKKRLPQTAFLLKAVFAFGRCGRRARQQRLCELAHGHAANAVGAAQSCAIRLTPHSAHKSSGVLWRYKKVKVTLLNTCTAMRHSIELHCINERLFL